MLERLVENWLTKASERTLEVPFCQMLSGEGHKVVHLSRHGPFEQGKDVITVAPDGTPCAFQLKSIDGKLTQRKWADFVPQITRLVELPIRHPSVDGGPHRRTYLVINGELEEEVREEITARNRDWVGRGHPRLETIVRGEILTRLTSLQTDFWPAKLSFERELLQLYTTDGRAYLDKANLYSLLSSIVDEASTSKGPRDPTRLLPSTAIFVSYALASFEGEDNHVAMIEGWTVFVSLLIALVERFQVPENLWKDTFDICLYAIRAHLEGLIAELKERPHFVEGNALVDAPFYRGRMTWLLSLVAVNELMRISLDPSDAIDGWAIEFITREMIRAQLWGDAAFPQLLALFFFVNQVGRPNESDRLLFGLIDGICSSHKHEGALGLPDPYHSLAEVVSMNVGLINREDTENFKGRSYSLGPILQLCARRGWRQALAQRWPDISRIDLAEFNVNAPWQYCQWHCEEGRLRIAAPGAPQSWTDLRDKSRQVDPSGLPQILRNRPWLLLLFLVVFPHRMTTEAAKFLDDHFRQVKIASRRVMGGPDRGDAQKEQ